MTGLETFQTTHVCLICRVHHIKKHSGSPRYLSSLVHAADVSVTPLCRIEPFADSTVQTVNYRWSSVSGRSSTVLEQAARQRYVSQFVDDLPATTEAHTIPAVIPRHYHVTLS